MSYISDLTDILFENGTNSFCDIVVVVPSQRAKNSLVREIAKRCDGPVFSPDITTIEDLVCSLSTLRRAESTELLITLFDICRQNQFANCADLREFMSWAPIFLQDINEIDMYDRNADDIFSDLSRIKELDFFGKENLTENQRKYLAFYYSLKDIYHLFTQQLVKKKKAYNGLIYKYVATDPAVDFAEMEGKKVYFAGLTALSPTELAFVKRIANCRGTQVEFVFDLDPFYFNANANTHLTTLVQEIQKELDIKKLTGKKEHFKTIAKNIDIVGATRKVNQIYIAIALLNKMTEEERNHTAVVMADESLIVPFVHAYSPENYNITASYPIRHTTAYQLLHTLFAAAQNLRRLQSGAGEATNYYFRDILVFFRNELVGQALFFSSEKQQEFIQSLIKKGRVFLTPKEFRLFGKDVFPDLSKDGKLFIEQIVSFLDILIQGLSDKKTDEKSNNVALLSAFRAALAKVEDTLDSLGGIAVDLQTLLHFVNDEIEKISLSFRGTQSEGLQVMGLLETRLLDFDNLIILGVNEGILPTGKSSDSLLLFDVKRHYQLPTYEHKDAIGAYHFFRLLQRAKNATIIYDTDTSTSLTEESRFIRQLEFEVKRQNLTETIKINRTKVTIKPTFDNNVFQIKKSDEIIEKLQDKETKFSASSLNCYINCPLQFYFEYIAKIKPQKTVSEDVETNVIGSVIHKVLEDLFNKLQHNEALKDKRDTIFENARKELEGNELIAIFKQEAKELKEQDFTRGKLLLAVEIVRQYLKKYFEIIEKDFEKNGTLINIVETEMELGKALVVDGQEVQFTGKADLVEEIGTITHIFDYKTGKIHELKMPKETGDIFKDVKYKQLVQLLLYNWMYTQTKDKDPKATRCELIGFREMMTGNEYILSATKNDGTPLVPSAELLTEFQSGLDELLSDILDKDQPFTQTKDEKHCKFCDYQGICDRQNSDENF